jgi:hypothetical protein
MDIRFLCLQGGRQYYEVVLQGEPIFVGSRSECDRFIKIHDQKVADDQAEDLKDPRSRSVPVRVYRQARARA